VRLGVINWLRVLLEQCFLVKFMESEDYAVTCHGVHSFLFKSVQI
jgi:hypothetical protein